MSKDPSTRYYQKNKEKSAKKARECYLDLSKEEKKKKINNRT